MKTEHTDPVLSLLLRADWGPRTGTFHGWMGDFGMVGPGPAFKVISGHFSLDLCPSLAPENLPILSCPSLMLMTWAVTARARASEAEAFHCEDFPTRNLEQSLGHGERRRRDEIGNSALQRILEHSWRHSLEAGRSTKQSIGLAGSSTWSGFVHLWS